MLDGLKWLPQVTQTGRGVQVIGKRKDAWTGYISEHG